MIPLNSARRMRSEGTPSRHSTALLLLTALCTLSIIPALQRAQPATDSAAAARSPGLIRRALDPGAYKWQSVTIRDGQTLINFLLTPRQDILGAMLRHVG